MRRFAHAHKRAWCWMLWAALLLCLAGIFVWQRPQWLRPFVAPPQWFDPGQLRLPDAIAQSERIRFVHFWDPACPCGLGNQQHLLELVAEFAPLGVDFYALQKSGSHGHLSPPLRQKITELDPLAEQSAVPASPAVGIWDAQGVLIYFGPYSAGFVCSAGNSFTEPVLHALLAGRAVRATKTLASGCFCSWR